VAVALPSPEAAPALDRVASALDGTPGIHSAQPPVISDDGRAAAIVIQPDTGPQDAATADLVERLRTSVLPAATAGTGASAYVGGQTALDDDLAAKVSERLPIIVGAVLLASVVLIAALVRAPVIALVSAVLTLLSVGAAYGMAVAAYQWQWASGLLGLGASTPIPAAAALLLFVILFGLSMDYNIFLLSRMREHYRSTGRAREAVVESLRSTAGVVLSAGVIMVAVFCAFATSPEPTVRITASALAAAVLVDLLLVRLLLSPAVLLLLGDRAWSGTRRPRIGAGDDRTVPAIAVASERVRA
jgi:RND superfamily putative drug exporter